MRSAPTSIVDQKSRDLLYAVGRRSKVICRRGGFNRTGVGSARRLVVIGSREV